MGRSYVDMNARQHILINVDLHEPIPSKLDEKELERIHSTMADIIIENIIKADNECDISFNEMGEDDNLDYANELNLTKFSLDFIFNVVLTCEANYSPQITSGPPDNWDPGDISIDIISSGIKELDDSGIFRGFKSIKGFGEYLSSIKTEILEIDEYDMDEPSFDDNYDDSDAYDRWRDSQFDD